MNKPLDLCNADINKAVFKNVMFFSIAEGRAMGKPGGDGSIYYISKLVRCSKRYIITVIM